MANQSTERNHSPPKRRWEQTSKAEIETSGLCAHLILGRDGCGFADSTVSERVTSVLERARHSPKFPPSNTKCHSDRSAAEWRNLQLLFPGDPQDLSDSEPGNKTLTIMQYAELLRSNKCGTTTKECRRSSPPTSGMGCISVSFVSRHEESEVVFGNEGPS